MQKFCNLILLLSLIVLSSEAHLLKKSKLHSRNKVREIVLPKSLDEAVNYNVEGLNKDEYCASDRALLTSLSNYKDSLSLDKQGNVFQQNIDVLNEVLGLMEKLKAMINKELQKGSFVEIQSRSLQTITSRAENKGLIELKTKIDGIVDQANSFLQLKDISSDTLAGVEKVISITNELIQSLKNLDANSQSYLDSLTSKISQLNSFC